MRGFRNVNSLNKVATFFTKSNVQFFTNRFLLVPFFMVPVLLLYMLEPMSFELVSPGRAMYLIFLCLLLLEIVLAWDKPLKNPLASKDVRVFAALTCMLCPTLYVILTLMLGFKGQIIEIGRILGVPYREYGSWFLEVAWPVSIEVFLYVCFFLLSVWLLYGISGIRRFSISGFFLGASSIFNILGQVFFPAGSLQVAQSFVPVTVAASTWLLNLLSYTTFTAPVQGGSLLRVAGNSGSAAFLVYWPSAGIQSLVIYSFTILLFLKGAAMPYWRKGTYFVVGTVGTFFVNVLRIVSICLLAVNVGVGVGRMFHDYYGELYFIAWMIVYLLIIFFIESFLKRRSPKVRVESETSSLTLEKPKQ